MTSLRDYNHVDLLFPSRYLKAADLRGRDLTVQIMDIDPRGELQMRGGKHEYKPIVTVRGTEKLWVLNKTNAQTIARLYGPEVTAWLGQSVTLYATQVPCGGQMVDALRVREVAPKTRGAKDDTARILAAIDAAQTPEELLAAAAAASALPNEAPGKPRLREAYRRRMAELAAADAAAETAETAGRTTHDE